MTYANSADPDQTSCIAVSLFTNVSVMGHKAGMGNQCVPNANRREYKLGMTDHSICNLFQDFVQFKTFLHTILLL